MLNLRENKGITLIEVMVSMTILAILVIPLSQLLVSAVLTNLEARRVQTATTIAQKYIELFKHKDIEDLLEEYGDHFNEQGKLSIIKAEDEAGYEIAIFLDPDPFKDNLLWHNQIDEMPIPDKAENDIWFVPDDLDQIIQIYLSKDDEGYSLRIQGMDNTAYHKNQVPTVNIDVREHNDRALQIEVTNLTDEPLSIKHIMLIDNIPNIDFKSTYGSMHIEQYYTNSVSNTNPPLFKVYHLTVQVSKNGKSYSEIRTTKGER